MMYNISPISFYKLCMMYYILYITCVGDRLAQQYSSCAECSRHHTDNGNTAYVAANYTANKYTFVLRKRTWNLLANCL